MTTTRRAFAAGAAAVLLARAAGAVETGGSGGPARPLRLLTFNVLGQNRDYPRLEAYLERTGPDVVLLQEARDGWEAALGTYPLRRRSGRLLTASRLPPAARQAPAETGGDVRHLRLVLDAGHRPLTVYNFHPVSPRNRNGVPRREANYRALAAALAAEPPGQAVVVGGDFNAVPGEDVFAELVAGAGLTLFDGGTLATPTRYPKELGLPVTVGVPIDHVAGRGAFRVVSRTVGPDLGSDHLPVLVDVVLG